MEAITLSCSSRSRKMFDTISILVVDDDTTSLAMVAGMLKQFKYNVVTVKNPKDALCTLRIKRGMFDLVVTDLHMPDMNGIELLGVILEEFDLPVILVSADDKDCIVLQALKNGAVFFLTKPVCPDDLRDLWQFAAMKRKGNVVIEEIHEGKNPDNDNRRVPNEIVAGSSSYVNEDLNTNKRNDEKKASRRKDSNQKHGDKNSQSVSRKNPKIIWNSSLHNCFLNAIRKIGFERAVPKKILDVMNVPGLTRENVASHLQKYRIFLRRVSDASFKVDSRLASDKLIRFFPPHHQTIQPNLLIKKQNFQLGNGNPTNAGHNPMFPNQESQIGNGILYLQSSSNSIQGNNMFNNSVLSNLRAPMIDSSSTAGMIYGTSYRDPLQENNRTNVLASGLSQNLTYQSEYVGYNISSIKHLTEMGKGSSSKASVHELGNGNKNISSTVGDANNSAGLAQNIWASNCIGQGETNNGSQQVYDVNALSFQVLPTLDPLAGCNESQLGRYFDIGWSPLIDISENGHLSNIPQELEEVNNDIADISNQLNNLNQQTGSGYYETSSNWMNNQCPTLDQTANQQNGGVMSGLYESSSQHNKAFMLPLQQAHAVQANSFGLTSSDQLNNNMVARNMPNTNLITNQSMANINLAGQDRTDLNSLISDDDFLEGLFASFNGDQTLEEI